MTKLILEEGGQKRAFRVNKGRLTIGSGEGCTLRLAASDVAEVHAELEVSEAGVMLKPRPGVMPPVLNGRPVQQPTKLPPGASFRIGAATFQLEGAAPPAAAGAPASTGTRRTPRSVVQPSRPLRKIERGMPTWAILALFGLVIAVGFGFFRMYFGEAAKVEYDPRERLRVAQEAYDESYNDRALAELERVDLTRAPELADQVAALRAKIAARGQDAELRNWNAIGSEYLETQIKRFYEQRLQGDKVPRERARVFVSRCREFREKWPQHPELDWVRRFEARFEALAQLDDPPTLADVAYDVETLTWAKPRDYGAAFQRLRDFMAGAQGSDFDAARQLEDELSTGQQEYFVDRMQEAKHQWTKDEPGKAVGELVQLIVFIGDEDLADQAAQEMVVLPRIDEHLRGYQSTRPERWEQLMENRVVRAKAQELGLL